MIIAIIAKIGFDYESIIVDYRTIMQSLVSVSHYMLNSKETEVALNLDPLLSESSVL